MIRRPISKARPIIREGKGIEVKEFLCIADIKYEQTEKETM